jgi:hypothetical protein
MQSYSSHRRHAFLEIDAVSGQLESQMKLLKAQSSLYVQAVSGVVQQGRVQAMIH